MTAPVRLYEYAAVAKYVVDGDTLDLQVDLGFRIQRTERFRLLGIDTPERGQPGYWEAKRFVMDLFDVPRQPEITIRTHLDKTDKYGRMLAEVWYYDFALDSWNNLADLMIAHGLGKPYAGGTRS